jgi:hypothetical protein
MAIKDKIWLMQRLKEPEDFVNPFGNVNVEIKDTDIDDVIDPDYMGAAEYEWGAYSKCIDEMYKWGVFNVMIYIYSNKDEPKLNRIPVNIVHCNGADIDNIIEQVRYLYLEVSRIYHKTGSFFEISKNDRGSFYRALQDRNNPKYIGWLNIKEYYAIFPSGDHAEYFINHVNNMHKKTAYNLKTV